MKKLSSYICSALLCASILPAFAESSAASEHPSKRMRHAPPAEAIAACKGLTEKTTCQFTNRKDEIIAGVCRTPRHADENAELACRPQHHKQRLDEKDAAEK